MYLESKKLLENEAATIIVQNAEWNNTKECTRRTYGNGNPKKIRVYKIEVICEKKR